MRFGSAAVAVAALVRQSCLIAAPEPLAVCVSQFARNARAPELIVSFNVQLAVAFEILARLFHSVVESTSLDLVKLPWRRIPSAAVGFAHLAVRLAHLPVMIAHLARHGQLVSAAKTVTVLFAELALDARMTELIAVFGNRAAAVCEIIACRLDPIVEPTTLNIA